MKFKNKLVLLILLLIYIEWKYVKKAIVIAICNKKSSMVTNFLFFEGLGSFPNFLNSNDDR